MKRQNITGKSTEATVKTWLTSMGLVAQKPIPDRGVDLEVYDPSNPTKTIKLQIKGRGEKQSSRRYRWFQIRTTQKQRDTAISLGLPVSEAWRKKVDLCDFFILVSEKHNEQWVFPGSMIHEIIEINKKKYGNRQDNISGIHAEMDLDVEHDGQPLTRISAAYLDNFGLIKDKLSSVQQGNRGDRD